MSKKKVLGYLSSLIPTLIFLIIILILCAGRIPHVILEFKTSLSFSRALTAPISGSEMYLHVIDVGQGDAILVRTADACILIDTGTNESEDALDSHLCACKVKTVDYLICSHPHSDHIGGADTVLAKYDVKTLITLAPDSADAEYARTLSLASEVGTDIVYPKAGDAFTVGDICLTVLASITGTNDSNEASIVIRMDFKDASFLFTGDIGKSAEHTLLDTYTNGELDTDFLKVAHHGADTSTTDEFIAAVSPYIASVSCGRNNDFGHPRHEVLKRLRDGGCELILRTDKMGSIIVHCDGQSIDLVAMREVYDGAKSEY